MKSQALLKLLYLVSPALPVGAYAYSQGQEYAVDIGWLKDDGALSEWILGVLKYSVATTDAPILCRCYQAWLDQDFELIDSWNNFLIATRETKELLLEDEQLGQALARLLDSHELDIRSNMFSQPPSYPVLFALAGAEWRIPVSELLEGFLWSWLENQVAAATKTIPLGQTQAQHILMRLLPKIPSIAENARCLDDKDIGAGLPGLALASCLHERQYSRLFRS